ncbi:MAG: polyprenyl synthetase family protein [Candidatus Mcinerneyibacterium aminivorans]|uniref:Polyprenyl synthetase family protein n=1 Tax=Candidatus Mcinerneyibacterium aminivorans TaxID=2703815 RepID=A0A5D0MGF0_9BACT|nr:MAG: polyprenyl synthetase family protein [Candidatus Mcinerneyibacterium aminivorans]
MNIKSYLKDKKKEVDEYLDNLLPKTNKFPAQLHEAMRYTIFAGGKRVRPILCIASFQIFDSNYKKVLPFASALEIIHTYSLIHDDLPAMDNDSLRRGKPTNHKVYGEAKAILAADALLTFAFQTMAESSNFEDRLIKKAIFNIAKSSGYSGIVGGQFVDIDMEGKDIDLPTLEYIHTHKTGELIKTSVYSGALLAGAKDEDLDNLLKYAKWLGLTFQIVDDILDEIGDKEELGKNPGKDNHYNKFTYPSIYGIKKSKKIAEEYTQKSKNYLAKINADTSILNEISNFLLERTY